MRERQLFLKLGRKVRVDFLANGTLLVRWDVLDRDAHSVRRLKTRRENRSCTLGSQCDLETVVCQTGADHQRLRDLGFRGSFGRYACC